MRKTEKEIKDNYFHRMFLQENKKILVENMKNKIRPKGDEVDPRWMLMFPTPFFPKEEILEAYNKSLFHVCTNYISLSDSKIDVFPSNTFELVVDILDEIKENPYKFSFLLSLQLIYKNYFECLEVGIPILFPLLFQPEEETQESYMNITLNSQYQLVQFDRVNISLLEQTKIMTEFVIMQKNKQIGPLQKVKYYYRKDT